MSNDFTNPWDHDECEPLGDINEMLEQLRPRSRELFYRTYNKVNIKYIDCDCDEDKLRDHIIDVERDELLYGESFKLIKDGKEHRVPPVNVGTIGHCDYTQSILKTANVGQTMLIGTRAILAICASMGLTSRITEEALQKYNDYKPRLFSNRQSWQAMNKGQFSKKQRRK